MSDPLRPIWQARELQRILGDVTWRSRLFALESPFLAELRRFEQLRHDFLLPSAYVDISRQIRQSMATADLSALTAMQSLDHSFTKTLFEQQAQLRRSLAALGSIGSDFKRIHDLAQASLAPMETLLRVQKISARQLDFALWPHDAFQSLARKHIELASRLQGIARQNHLRLVSVSADWLPEMSHSFELASLMYPGDLRGEVIARPTRSVFERADELATITDFDGQDSDPLATPEVEELASVVDLGSSIVQLVHDLNVEAEREGEPPVFKPTTKVLAVCAKLPVVSSDTEALFGDIVDGLYFLLYEGSGAGDRLTSRLSSADLAVLWRIKHLRLGFRHDVDHGDAGDAQAKAMKIGNAYRSLIGQPTARSQAEWRRAQVVLYRDIVTMLEKVWFGIDSGDE